MPFHYMNLASFCIRLWRKFYGLHLYIYTHNTTKEVGSFTILSTTNPSLHTHLEKIGKEKTKKRNIRENKRKVWKTGFKEKQNKEKK